LVLFRALPLRISRVFGHETVRVERVSAAATATPTTATLTTCGRTTWLWAQGVRVAALLGFGHKAVLVPRVVGFFVVAAAREHVSHLREREFFVDNLLVRIRFIIVVIRWTGLTPAAREHVSHLLTCEGEKRVSFTLTPTMMYTYAVP